MRRILIYNWIPFDNKWGIGGGVTVYCKNLIGALIKYCDDVEICFVSSGWAYDYSNINCYYINSNNIFGERCKSYEIVNSPIPASQRFLLKNPSMAFKSEKLRNVVQGFYEKEGPFDVVHFNNVEGLSLDCIEYIIKNTKGRTIYSMHNYIPVCITGFYYLRHLSKNCNANYDCNDCKKCCDTRVPKRVFNELTSEQRQISSKEFDLNDKEKWWYDSELYHLDEYGDKEDLIIYCELLKRLINEMDKILAVSNRVKQIATNRGIDGDKCITSYIGTKIADVQMGRSNTFVSDKFRIVYLGSSVNSKEKGYPFLIDSLSAMEEKYKKNIQLRLTTTDGNESELKKSLGIFDEIEIVHGYTHDELPSILKDCHLGVVPVMWEDNLPQIAIEMLANGVPILVSNFGGASELADDKKFVFRGGDKTDFLNKLIGIIEHPRYLDDYWSSVKKLVTMSEHINEIMEVYGL